MRRALLGLALVALLGYMLSSLILELPEMGSPESPPYVNTAPRYLERNVAETGSMNVVTGIILDYRAYDTLGEATVLFTAALGILALRGGH